MTANTIHQNWLTILCQQLEGARTALLLEKENDGTLRMIAKWPNHLSEVDDFSPILQFAVPKQASVTVTGVQQADNSVCDFFVYPLDRSGFKGILAVKHSTLPKEQHDAIFAILENTTKWLALTETSQESNADEFYSSALNLLAACVEQKSYKEALVSLTTELTLLFECEQVAIGEYDNLHTKVVALSNSVKLDDRANFIQKIAGAMDESIEQDCLIAFPEANAGIIQRAHQELARRFGSGVVLTLPLVDKKAIIGAVTLLRTEEKPFNVDSVKLVKVCMALLAPYLALKKEQEKGLFSKAVHSLQQSLADIFGFKQLKTKLVASLIALVLVGGAVVKGDFKITADAVLEGKIQRVVASPIDGFLLSASVRAGDTVRQSELLATLDDAELELELSKLNGQLQKYRREYREALSANDLVKVRVVSAQIDQANAEIDLTRRKMQKIALTAPFDSVVIEGDLSQQLGSPVKQGDVLFKIAPLAGYRIILKVNERHISYVSPGQTGILALAALPEQDLNLKVEKITAVAKAEGGQNIFRVEASLDNAPKLLRPGMEGIGKINAGRRSYLWLWTHEIINWLRIWTWSWSI